MAGLMAAAPNQSLPKQSEDWADLKTAYRFLHHERVTPELIPQTHCKLVCQACTAHHVILGLHDISELDFTQ